jgi:hypothetical protein
MSSRVVDRPSGRLGLVLGDAAALATDRGRSAVDFVVIGGELLARVARSFRWLLLVMGRFPSRVSNRRGQYRRSTTRAASISAVITATSNTAHAGIAALEQLWRCASEMLTGHPTDQVAVNLGESAVFDAQTGVRARTVEYRRTSHFRYGAHVRAPAVPSRVDKAACRSQGWLTGCERRFSLGFAAKVLPRWHRPRVGSPLVGSCVSWMAAGRGSGSGESLPGRQAGETTNTAWALS